MSSLSRVASIPRQISRGNSLDGLAGLSRRHQTQRLVRIGCRDAGACEAAQNLSNRPPLSRLSFAWPIVAFGDAAGTMNQIFISYRREERQEPARN